MARHIIETVVLAPRHFWRWLRAASGDDEYDRYLDHWRRAHHDGPGAPHAPLSRRDFFRLRQSERWEHIRRCC